MLTVVPTLGGGWRHLQKVLSEVLALRRHLLMGSRAPKLGTNQDKWGQWGFTCFGRKRWGVFEGFIMVIKSLGLWDRDKIGAGRSGMSPQLCITSALPLGASRSAGGLGWGSRCPVIKDRRSW